MATAAIVSVVIYSAGPVGLRAAMSANLRAANQVFVVDRQPDRLKLVDLVGAIPIDDSRGDAVQQVLDATRGEGADRGVEAVVSHELNLDQAAEGYRRFDERGRLDQGAAAPVVVRGPARTAVSPRQASPSPIDSTPIVSCRGPPAMPHWWA